MHADWLDNPILEQRVLDMKNWHYEVIFNDFNDDPSGQIKKDHRNLIGNLLFYYDNPCWRII